MLSRTTNFSGAQNSGRNARFTPPAVSHSLADSLEMMGASMSYVRNAEIYGENEPTDYLYKLISGTVRTAKILNDGRRQIGEFYLPGDLFGHEVGSEHSFAAEAITEVKVIVIKRTAVEALAARDNDVARQLWAMTGRELQRMQRHILLLIQSAQERVAGFLLEMAERIKSTNEVELPMSRQDIADYLGLTMETVSRTLTILENSAAIQLSTSRRIVLRNRAALRRLGA
jgi:CRP/FNR family transcriptional regulator, nitrogen fixation regulation protein